MATETPLKRTTSPKRLAAIRAALQSGKIIKRHWEGSSGRMRCSLIGVPRLGDTEVEQLKRDGLLRIITKEEMFKLYPGTSRGPQFWPLVLR